MTCDIAIDIAQGNGRQFLLWTILGLCDFIANSLFYYFISAFGPQ